MMSASDLALTAGDTPDVPSTVSAYVALMAALSQAVDPNSDRYIPGTRVGDLVIYTSSNKPKVFPGATGFKTMVLAFERLWIGRPEGDEPIRYPKKPPDVAWLDRGDHGVEQPGHYRIGPDGELGNRVVLTLIAYLLVDGIDEVVSLSFTKSALRMCGNGFMDMAQKIAVRIGPDGLQWVTGCTLGKFRVTSRLVDNGTRRWHVPKVELIGRLGEEGGPTLEEWRHAQSLRIAAKAPPPKPVASPPKAPLVAGPAEYDDNPDMVPEGVVEDDVTEDVS
jgi:hypothetical protein